MTRWKITIKMGHGKVFTVVLFFENQLLKLCAINKIEKSELIHPVIDKLLLGLDKQI